MMVGWVQLWYIWYSVRTFVNVTMYPLRKDYKNINHRRSYMKIQHLLWINFSSIWLFSKQIFSYSLDNTLIVNAHLHTHAHTCTLLASLLKNKWMKYSLPIFGCSFYLSKWILWMERSKQLTHHHWPRIMFAINSFKQTEDNVHYIFLC
jgi:hypothetical protein